MNYPDKTNAHVGIHADAIHSLARQYKVDEKIVKEIYERELEKLTIGTRITSFIPILCLRHAKELIIRVRKT